MARVLVVDDEAHLRVYLAAVCRAAGHEAVTAADGAQALARMRDAPPDLVTLDLMMPGEGGLACYRALRLDPVLARIPILVVSAVGEPVFRHALRTLEAGLGALPPGGPVRHLQKPPDPEALHRALGELLSPLKREESLSPSGE